uniref:C-type lectin domain-containing protein n=1 Tax=Ciona savignyi TaxID=51511 RepID=H2Z601_CIOSA
TAIVSGGNKYTVGTVATYTCSGARGFTGTFEELYKKKLTCLSTGAWSSSTAPECVTGTTLNVVVLCQNNQVCAVSGDSCRCDTTTAGHFCEWKSLLNSNYFLVSNTLQTSFAAAESYCTSLRSSVSLFAPVTANNIRQNFYTAYSSITASTTGWIHVTRSSAATQWVYTGSTPVQSEDFCTAPNTELCAVANRASNCWNAVSCTGTSANPICFTTVPSP